MNIRVTDANDNSPVFRNASYSVNVSEVGLELPLCPLFHSLTHYILNYQSAMIGSVVLSNILAVDADQPGPYSTVQYSILPGPHSVKETLIYNSESLQVFFTAFSSSSSAGCPRISKQLGRCFSAKKSTRL